MDSDSDTSSLSSAAPEEEIKKLAPIFMKAKKATKLVAPPPAVSPPRPKRPPSPPHEEVLADNPDIAFIVMFRARFHDAFSSKLANFGPQDIEFGIVDTIPSPQMESLLCALLGLVLNRKKPIERGHHGRALEEAVATNKPHWPLKWAGQNPLHGGRDFRTMAPSERLNLLRTLIMWALSSSEVVSGIIKDRYKQNRHADDENQPLSVQPWGADGDKRRYFLIQGLDDTGFRVYREAHRYTKNAQWYSMAGSIDEVKALAEKLEKVDGTQAARRLGVKMINAIPMFEATEEKRRRREYRQQRRAAFSRPEPGFGIYEGRTRGKRMRYTYDDEDADLSDSTSARRSTRHQSARSTPFEAGPTITASGRQVRQPRTGDYGESLLSGHVMTADDLAPEYEGDDSEDPLQSGMRATRSGGNARKRKHIEGYNSIDVMSDEEDADEWDSDKNDGDDDDEDMAEAEDADVESGVDARDHELDDDEVDPQELSTLVVKLKMRNQSSAAPTNDTPPTSPPQPSQSGPTCDAKDVAQKTASVPSGNGEIARSAVEVSKSEYMNGTAKSTTNGSVEYPTPSSNAQSVAT